MFLDLSATSSSFIFASFAFSRLYCTLQNILLIFHVPSFYNKLHLVNALFARTQTSFGIDQTV